MTLFIRNYFDYFNYFKYYVITYVDYLTWCGESRDRIIRITDKKIHYNNKNIITVILFKSQKYINVKTCRGRYPVLGHPLPWAISFFITWEENKYFSPYAYCFIFKSDLLNSNFVENNSYFILFFLERYFFDEHSNFWMFGFIETNRLNVDSFTNENWNKCKCHRSKVSQRKKNIIVNKILWIISYKNFKARALGHLENVNKFCDNLEQAMAQLGKNYSPSNIYNLIVKRSFFQNKKVQIIQRLILC